MQKDEFKKELEEFFKIRDKLFAFLDSSLPKDKYGISFDFNSNPTINAQELYKFFYKYDYKARKTFATASKLINGAH